APESRPGELRRATPATDLLARLEQQHVESFAGEQRRRGQPVGASAHHDHVVRVGAQEAPRVYGLAAGGQPPSRLRAAALSAGVAAPLRVTTVLAGAPGVENRLEIGREHIVLSLNAGHSIFVSGRGPPRFWFPAGR